MILVLLMMIYAAMHTTVAGFYGKYVINKGISPKNYAYTTNIMLLVFLIPLFLWYPLDISLLGWQLVLIIIAAGTLRTLQLIAFGNALKKISPMELQAATSLTLVLTYCTDIFFGLKEFNFLSSGFLLLIIVGVFIISNGSVGFKKVKWFLIVLVLAALTRGYLVYFAMRYTNPTTFNFLVSLITAIGCLPFTKLFKPTKQSFKYAAPIQASGAFYIVLMGLLASMQITLRGLVNPASIAFTIIASTLFIKRSKTKNSQILGALIVLFGVILYVLI